MAACCRALGIKQPGGLLGQGSLPGYPSFACHAGGLSSLAIHAEFTSPAPESAQHYWHLIRLVPSAFTCLATTASGAHLQGCITTHVCTSFTSPYSCKARDAAGLPVLLLACACRQPGSGAAEHEGHQGGGGPGAGCCRPVGGAGGAEGLKRGGAEACQAVQVAPGASRQASAGHGWRHAGLRARDSGAHWCLCLLPSVAPVIVASSRLAIPSRRPIVGCNEERQPKPIVVRSTTTSIW